MWVKHCRLINMLQPACAGSLYGKKLYIDICHIHGCTLYRQTSHIARVDALPVNQTRNLDTGFRRQIRNQVIPAAFRGLPISLLAASIIAMVLVAFK